MSRSTWTLPPRKRESPPDKLVAALRSNAVLGRELGSLPQGQPVPRDTFLQVFGTVVKELKVGTFLAALSIRPGNTIPPVQPTPTNTPAMQKQFYPLDRSPDVVSWDPI